MFYWFNHHADKIYQYSLATAFDIIDGNLSSDGNFDLLNNKTATLWNNFW